MRLLKKQPHLNSKFFSKLYIFNYFVKSTIYYIHNHYPSRLKPHFSYIQHYCSYMICQLYKISFELIYLGYLVKLHQIFGSEQPLFHEENEEGQLHLDHLYIGRLVFRKLHELFALIKEAKCNRKIKSLNSEKRYLCKHY